MMYTSRSYLKAAGLLNPSVKACIVEGNADGKLQKGQETQKLFLYGVGLVSYISGHILLHH